jgi:threonine dehydratase
MSGESDEDLKDAFCDPANPITVQFQEVSAAAYKIKGGIERTPCPVSSLCLNQSS